MEFVGWGVKKEIPDGGTLLGVVLAFESGSGRFEIVYENGETENLDWPGLSSMLVESSPGLPSRLPETKSRCIPSKHKDTNNSVDRSGVSGVLIETSGRLSTFGINLNHGLDLDEDGSSVGDIGGTSACSGVKLIGLDLNRGMSVELDDGLYLSGGGTETALRVEEEIIDLNMDANDDASDFKDDQDASFFDLNLQLPEDVSRNMNHFEEHSGAHLRFLEGGKPEEFCRSGHGESFMSKYGGMTNLLINMDKIKDGKMNKCVPRVDSENLTPIKGTSVTYSSDDNAELAAKELLKVEFEAGRTELKLENKDGILMKNGDVSGYFDNGVTEHVSREKTSRKRKKMEHGASQATSATALRRSSRRAKIDALYAKSEISSEVELVNHGNQASSPAGSVISEERATVTACEDSPNYDITPPKVDLPTSCCLDLDGSLVFDVFYAYSFLRSFSNLLLLSPFELKAFVTSIKCDDSTLLFDSIHVSLLRALRKQLETLSYEGSTSASDCLRSLNWDFLDLITWPMFLLQYIILHSSWYTPGCSLSQLKIFENDYYKLPVSAKAEILRHICDDVCEGEAFRSDVNRRELGLEQLTDLERATKYDSSRKRRAAMDAANSSCVTEENLVVASDFNADECHLCKMDGNLICCDGCPAAFHSRCVGVASSLLPEGHWYCPECAIEKDANEWFIEKTKLSRRVGNSIRAEVLGRDPYGRLYYATCGYLLVLESLNGDDLSTHLAIRLYNRDDFPKLFEVMDLSPFIYDKIKTAICVWWNAAFSGTNDADTAFLLTQSTFPRKGTSDIIPLRSEVVTPEILNDCPRVMSTVTEDAFSHVQGGEHYVNYYEFARTAYSCFRELSSPLPDKSLSAEEILARQLKIVSNRLAEFSWSNAHLYNSNSRNERCGWCFYCRDPENGRDCLFILKNDFPSLENFSITASGIQARNSRKSPLSEVINYILCLESHLHGLLLGPWLNPHYYTIWRRTLLEAICFSSLKNMILKLESNLHHLALSAEWNKHVDSHATVGSACHVIRSSFRALSRNGNCKKRAKSYDVGVSHPSSNAATGLCLFWWRGGRGSQMLFSWKVLPRSLALKAARKGGLTKIPGILYPENGDYAKRTKCISWRAAVETSKRVDQLALQVRELDANIRWGDISNNTLLRKTDGDCKKSFRSFKKVIIRRKFSDGTVTKYLLDFGKRRAVPDVVTKFGSLVDDSKSLTKKFWLEESHVPLHLIKSFEERKIARKSVKLNHDLSLAKMPRDRKGLDYLFSRLEASNIPTCGHCQNNVPVGEAVICEQCKGTFHKRHVRKSAGAMIDHCTYTCRRCEVLLPKIEKDKFEMLKVKNLSKGVKSIRLQKGKKKRRGKQVMNLKGAKRALVVPLRRSARFAERKIKLSTEVEKVKIRKKRKPVKSGNVILKMPTSSSMKKRSSMCYGSYWLNGLRLSRRPNDGRFSHLRERMSLVLCQPVKFNGERPKCGLCGELEYNPSLKYVACTLCGVWFHGDAVGLTEEKLENVIDFKCYSCLHKSSPECPHLC